MGFHTFPIERAEALEDPTRFRFCSREELVSGLALDRVVDDRAGGSTVADLGSGTGFYTEEVAPFVSRLYAVDVQPAMHRRYERRGMSSNVRPISTIVDALPFDADTIDGAFSTMTHHEYATSRGLEEIERVLRPGGRLVTVDWSGTGTGEDGPPLGERFSPEEATSDLEAAGFEVIESTPRPETFRIVARVP